MFCIMYAAMTFGMEKDAAMTSGMEEETIVVPANIFDLIDHLRDDRGEFRDDRIDNFKETCHAELRGEEKKVEDILWVSRSEDLVKFSFSNQGSIETGFLSLLDMQEKKDKELVKKFKKKRILIFPMILIWGTNCKKKQCG